MKVQGMGQKLKALILIAFFASIIWTYISITSKPQVEQDKEISLTAIPKYQIIAGKDVIPYPKGTIFEQGMASYFYATAPMVIVSPEVSVTGMDTALLNGTIESKIILQAVDDKSQIYWQYVQQKLPLQTFTLSQKVSGAENQLSVTTDKISFDVNSAYGTIIQIANDLLFQNGTLQIVVSSKIHVQGTVNGINTDKNLTLLLPVNLAQTSFIIPKSQDITTNVSLIGRTGNTSVQPSLLSLFLRHVSQFLINLILLLMFLLLSIYDNRMQSKSVAAHKRYREWITEGSVEIPDSLQVNILNLEGLVDLAIDLNKRVIYDAGKSKYYVLAEDIIYLFDPERLKALYDSRQKLGKLLLEQGLIAVEQLEIGLYYHKKTGRRLGESLIALGFIDEATLYSTLAAQQNMDYYELDPGMEITSTDWLNKMSIQKARAMLTLPLGVRVDGKRVIACGEIYREGIFHTLQEIFGQDICMVSSKPSVIYKILERLDKSERELSNTGMEIRSEIKSSPTERLTKEERALFLTVYHQGRINQELFLKAAGLAEEDILSQIPKQENILLWLAGNNRIDAEFPGLLKGLDGAVNSMTRKLRHENQMPSLQEILLNANYLTKETVEYINHAALTLQVPPKELLIKNYYASEETVNKVLLIQNILNGILNT